MEAGENRRRILENWWPQFVIAAWGCVLAAVLFTMFGQVSGGRRVVEIRGVDSVFYFSTCHAILFRQSYDLRSEFQALQPKEVEPCRWGCRDGLPSSPYAMGYSLLALPFLATGTLIDGMMGRPADGYSGAAMALYFLANIVFVTVGMAILARFLQSIWGPWQGLLLAFAMWFGTTLGYQSFAPMAHASTFMVCAAFLFVWWRIRESESVAAYALLGFVGGLLSICRWQDLLFLMAPPLAELLRIRKLPRIGKWLAYGAAAFLWWIPQLLQWKILNGRWITDPHGPGFLEPFSYHYVLQVLFSTKHGWFVWTPITLIGVAGLIWGARKRLADYLPWIVVIVLEVILVAAILTPHHYDDAFGIRMLTSSSPLIAWGIATLFLSLRRQVLKPLMAGLVALCCVYTTLFAVQYRLHLIPRDRTLTASQLFWDKIFIKQAYQRHLNEVRQANEPDSGQ